MPRDLLMINIFSTILMIIFGMFCGGIPESKFFFRDCDVIGNYITSGGSLSYLWNKIVTHEPNRFKNQSYPKYFQLNK